MAAVELPRGWHEARFPVMASAAHVIVHGPAALVADAEDRLRDLEMRWSRFVPHSEIARCNAASGRWCRVSSPTRLLLERSRQGWLATDGAFDPTVLVAVRAWRGETDETPRPAPGLGALEVDASSGAARMPQGVAFDPGGIGKGLAADLVAAETIAAGATAVLVNVGGDLRAIGEAPFAGGWGIEIEVDGSLGLAAIDAGGVATSSPAARTGSGPHGAWRHLIDPMSGASHAAGVTTATVVAPEAWLAEVWTKVPLQRGARAGVIAAGAAGVAALAGTASGCVHVNRRMAALLHGVRVVEEER
jgi:thiamine biosynthesis lipoprotein